MNVIPSDADVDRAPPRRAQAKDYAQKENRQADR